MRFPIRSAPPLLVLALATGACSEYELSHDDDPVGEPPECREQFFPGDHVTVDEECLLHAEGTFNPEVEWTLEAFTELPTSNNVMMTPIVVQITDDDDDGDIDVDDVPDILFVTYVGTAFTTNGTLRVVSGDGSGVVLTAAQGELGGSSGLAAADIDHDGIVEIVAATADYRVVCYEHDGTFKWSSEPFLAADVGGPGRMPAISDMDGDGSAEIVLGRVILNADGTTRGVGEHGVGTTYFAATSFAVDLDRDGTQEVVTGNALYDPDGNTIWYNGEQDGFVAAADFDGDGDGEIVVSGYAEVRLQDTDGTVLWRYSVSGGSYSNGGPPTVADFDGDGEPEVGMAGNNSYTVVDTDGTLLWKTTTQDGSSGVTGSSVFDFEGDGVAEAIYADEKTIWGYNGPDGAVRLQSSEHTSWTVGEYPVIADVDGDGEAEIVVPNGRHPSIATARYGVTVLGDADHSWQPGPRIWNQHAYHITNIEPDGSVPVVADVNWDTWNSFRSGDLTEAPTTYLPDLTVRLADLCDVQCESGELQVWAQVGNGGTVDVEGAVVSLWVESADGARQVASRTVDVGYGRLSDGLLLEAGGLDLATITDVYVQVEGPGGDWSECDTDNNVARWGVEVCAGAQE